MEKSDECKGLISVVMLCFKSCTIFMFKIMRKLYAKFCMLSFHLWIIIRPHNNLPHNHAGKGVWGGSLTYATYLHSPRKSPHSSECVTEAPGDSGWSRGNSCIPGVLSPSSLRLRFSHLHLHTTQCCPGPPAVQFLW